MHSPSHSLISIHPEEKEEPRFVTYLRLIEESSEIEINSEEGFLQHHFDNRNEKKALTNWLKKIGLRSVDQVEKTEFVVNLSKAEFKTIMGDEDFSLIQTTINMTEISIKVTDALNKKDYELFKSLISNPVIKNSKINQLRLMKTLSYDFNILPNLFQKELDDQFFKAVVDNIHPSIICLAYIDEMKDQMSTKSQQKPNVLQEYKVAKFLHPLLLEVLDNKILNHLFTSTYKKIISINPYDPKTIKLSNLYYCYINMTPDHFNLLLQKMGIELVETAVNLTSNPYETGLSDYAREEKFSDNFLILVKFLGPDTVGTMLSAQPNINKQNHSLFQVILARQPNSTLMHIMDFISADDLGEAIKFISPRTLNGLFYLTTNSNDDALIYAYKKISEEDRSFAITFRAYDSSTVLHDIAKHRGEEAVKVIIDLTPASALNECCLNPSNGGRQVIDWFFYYISSKTIAMLFKKIKYEAIAKMLNPSAYRPVAKNYINKIADGILNEPEWQHPTLLENMFTLLGQQLAPIAVNHWNMGKPLSPQTVKHVLANYTFSNKIEEKAFKKYKAVYWYQPDFEEKIDNSPIITSTNKSLIPSDKNFVETIWREGLLDWSHYRRLKSIESTILNLPLTLETLYLSERVTAGAMSDYILVNSDAKEDNQLSYITDRTQEENTLIKIIKSKDWDDFIKQLSDYNYRSSLREKIHKPDKDRYTHKYVHMTDEIVPYYPKRKTKTHTSTKKTSATIISKKMNTAVFGEHHGNLNLVGVLLNMAQCKVKAMLTQDKGTYKRKWIGTETQVKGYMENVKGITFKDIDKFREAVRNQPHRLNELLVKVTREAVMAIVIVTDSMAARADAISRQNTLQTQLNIVVPIVFYDRPLRKMRLFVSHNEYIENELKNNPEILCQKAMTSSKDFLAYINLISDKTLQMAAPTQSKIHRNATPLHIAATHQNSEIFMNFINKLTPQVLDETVGLVDEDKLSVIAAIAENQSPQVFKDYLTKLTGNGPNFQQVLNGPLLHIIIKNQNAESISYFLNMIPSNDLLNKMVAWSDEKGNNVLHLAPQHHEALVFDKFLKNVKWEDPALIATNLNLEIPLHILARHPAKKISESSLLTFLDEALIYDQAEKHAKKLNSLSGTNLITNNRIEYTSLLAMKNINNESVVHVAIQNQSNDIIDALIDKIPSELLSEISEIITKDNKTVLDLLFTHQPILTVMQLLYKIDDETLTSLLFHGKRQQAYIMHISDAIFFKTDSIPEGIINKLFSHFFLGPILFQTAENLWLEGNELSPKVLKQLLNSVETYHFDKLNISLGDINSEQKYPNLLSYTLGNINSEQKYRDPRTYKLYTSNKSGIDITKSDFVQTIWYDGLESWQDYHVLRKLDHEMKWSGLSETLDHLYKMGRVLTGSYQLYPRDIQNASHSTHLIKQGSALVKIIDNADWQNNLNKFIDRSFIPPNEQIPELKEDSYEYNFLNQTIQPYVSKIKDNDSNFTQPTIARLLSSLCNSILINNETTGKSQVGLLFDSKLTRVLAMLMTEGHLKPGSFIGSESYLNDYIIKLGSNSFTDWTGFNNTVNYKPHQANEVLFRASIESLAAIIIAEDSPLSREVARERYQQIKEALKIDLPVIIYNSTLRHVKLYTSDEMLEDKHIQKTGNTINFSEENECKARLLALKSDINNTSTLKKFSIFNQDKKPKTAEAILKIISEAENSPNPIWTKSAKEIKDILSKAIDHPGTSRKKETQEFYVTELKKYF